MTSRSDKHHPHPQIAARRIGHAEIIAAIIERHPPHERVDDLDPACALPGLVLNQPQRVAKVDTILNNSFGMLGINSTLIVKRFVR